MTASDGVIGNGFGNGVSLVGDRIVIGAFLDDPGSNVDQGSAYVFVRSGTTWTEQQKLTASDGVAGDQFGINTRLNQDRIIVGARNKQVGSNALQGAAYIYKFNGATWNEEKKLIATDGMASDSFGTGVEIDGTTAIVSANGADVPASFSGILNEPNKSNQLVGTDQGVSYVFDVLSGVFCHPVQPDLVSWWPGDGDSLDIRNRNDGILLNGATYGIGKVGQGFHFDGVDDYLEVSDSPGLNPTDEITMDGWVYPTATSGGTDFVGMILNKSTSPAANQYEVGRRNTTTCTIGSGIPEGNLAFLFAGLTGLPNDCNAWIDGFAPLPLNAWTHFAVTYDGAEIRVYANGVLTRTVSGVSGNLLTTNGSLRFSGRNGFAGSQFQGNIDEVQIFDRALTQTEIQGIFNADGRGKCKPTATVKPDGLVGHWAGDGDANDGDGSENGTLQNGAGFAISKVGQGFKLDGIDDYVSIPDSPANSVSTAVTVESWINPSAAPTVLGSILTKYNTPTGNLSYALSLRPDLTLQFAVYGNGSGTIVYGAFSTPTIPLDQYTHVAGTFDASTQTMKLFINGVEVPQTLTATDTVNPIFDGTSEVRIGSLDSFASGSVNQLFEGEIDEVSLYNTVLTPTEIKSIFDAGIAGKLKTVDTGASPLSGFETGKGKNPFGSAIVSTVGNSTITFSNVTTAGKTQQIPLDPNTLPALTNGTHTGLVYDISTSAVFTGNVDICFNLPAFTLSTDFAQLRVLHLENNVWENRTTTSDFGTRTLCGNVSSLSPFAIAQFAPTAAAVTISGRVMTQTGRGVPGANVQVTDQAGNIRIARTNQFGYYTFNNMEAGQILIFNVYNKQYQFETRVVNIDGNLSGLNFVAEN